MVNSDSAFWLPFSYGHLYGPPKDLAGFAKFMVEKWEALAPFSRGGDRVGLAGVDVSEPEIYVPALVDQFNSTEKAVCPAPGSAYRFRECRGAGGQIYQPSRAKGIHFSKVFTAAASN